jgi:hypothetical protein
MNKSMLIWALMATASIFTSCTRDESDVTTYTDTTIVELENRTRTGRGGCFELVFPTQIVLPDSTTVEVTSYQNLRETIVNWRKDNPDFDRRIRSVFVYPLDVVTKEGEVITVDTPDQFRTLYKDCKRSNFGHGKPCYKLDYPITLTFPGGTTTLFADAITMRKAIRTWKRANPENTDRPTLVFPLTIILEDGTKAVVNTKEDLRVIKEDCK